MTSSIDPGIRSANRPLMALSSPIGNVILQKPKKWLLQNLQQPLSKSGLLQPPLSARQPIIRRPLPDIHAAVHFAASKFSPVSVNIQRTVYPFQRKRTPVILPPGLNVPGAAILFQTVNPVTGDNTGSGYASAENVISSPVFSAVAYLPVNHGHFSPFPSSDL